MNPVFVILVLAAAVLLWFLLVFIFKPIGGFLLKLWKNAIDTMNEKENEKERKEDE